MYINIDIEVAIPKTLCLLSFEMFYGIWAINLNEFQNEIRVFLAKLIISFQ